jgi:L-glyceraldehyde 3-phosphate reductase
MKTLPAQRAESVSQYAPSVPKLSFGSWHIYSRMHFDDLCRQLVRAIESGHGFFDIGNYDGRTPRGDSIAHTDILFGRAMVAIGAARESYQVQTKVWLIDFPNRSLAEQLDTLHLRTGLDHFEYINLGMFQMAQGLDLDELLGQIDDLHRSGRIDGWGVTGWAPGVLADAHDRALAEGIVLPSLVQLKYGPSRRAVAEGQPFAELFARTDIWMQTSDTLEGGVILGKEPQRLVGTDMGNVRGEIIARVPRFLEVAADFGVHPATLGYAYALTHTATANALTGVRGLDQLETALAAPALAEKHGAELREALEFMWVDDGAVDVAAWS